MLEALGATSADGGESAGPRALRIAVASNLPPSPLTQLHHDNRGALEETAALLRRLGHEVDEVEVDHGPLVPPPEFTVLYLKSLHEEAASFAHPERLERRIRALARIGGQLPRGCARLGVGRRAAYAARVNEPLVDHDVLMTPVTPAPPPQIGAAEGLGWLRTSVVAAATVSYAALWNFTGQPACSVPAGFATDGLPRAVQLVGRPERRGDARAPGRSARGRAAVGDRTALPASRDGLRGGRAGAARHRGGGRADGRRAAAERARAGAEREVSSKSTPTDLVSEADRASERAIRALLAERRPEDGFVGEEGGAAQGDSGLSWVVDPLDGTVNFLFGIPQWNVSVAVRDDEGALAGAVYRPEPRRAVHGHSPRPALLDGPRARSS